MCLVISLCVLLKTPRIQSVLSQLNCHLRFQDQTTEQNLHPADWARPTYHETKGRTWKCLPVLSEQPTCAPNTLGSIQKQNWHRTFTTYWRIYQQSVCAPRKMDWARIRVYINTKSFGFLACFTAGRSTLDGWQSDEWGCEMTSVTRGFWQPHRNCLLICDAWPDSLLSY